MNYGTKGQLITQGCGFLAATAYAHVKGDKLGSHALKCIFLGYPEGIKAYKLWCLEEGMRKCIISRDVTFNEAEMGYKIQNNDLPEKADDDAVTKRQGFRVEVEPEGRHLCRA